jgi:hypothetical protein
MHANLVAAAIAHASDGVAPGIAALLNQEAVFFTTNHVARRRPVEASIINQSYSIRVASPAGVEQTYDNFAAQHESLMISAAAGQETMELPGTSYNGIAVGSFLVPRSWTVPQNRSKPDLVALPESTSFGAPLVSGAAAVLTQALEENGQKSDPRLLKALLLNGAAKPPDWTNSTSQPLHRRWGAGVLNLFNSVENSRGGAKSPKGSFALGSGQSPAAELTRLFQSSPKTSGFTNGFCLRTITSSHLDQAEAFAFKIDTDQPAAFFATLTWFRQVQQSQINDLNLFLYRGPNWELVAASDSTVDNVEHLFGALLPRGDYFLVVRKRGAGAITASETYALAFRLEKWDLSASSEADKLRLSFSSFTEVEESATLGNGSAWDRLPLLQPTLSDGVLKVELPLQGTGSFFRLREKTK